jgi:predicted transcriptional regulator
VKTRTLKSAKEALKYGEKIFWYFEQNSDDKT